MFEMFAAVELADSGTGTVLLAIVAAVPPTIVAAGALIVGIRNSRKADDAREKALIAAEKAAVAAVAAEDSKQEVIVVRGALRVVGKQLDGRLSEILALTAANALATGRAEGIAAEQERHATGGTSISPQVAVAGSAPNASSPVSAPGVTEVRIVQEAEDPALRVKDVRQ